MIGNKPFFYKSCEDKGLTLINDLLGSDGNFMSYDQARNSLQIDIDFLIFFSIVQSVKSFLMKECPLVPIEKVTGPLVPFNCKKLYCNRSGVQDIYTVFCKNGCLPTAQAKFSEKGILVTTDMWNTYYLLPRLVSRDTTLHYFQFRLLHRILPTNSLLNKINYADSSACTFCQRHPETLEHLFFECGTTQFFWKNLVQWIRGYQNIQMLEKKDILLGYPVTKDNTVLNSLILQGKFYIYRVKVCDCPLRFDGFKTFVKAKFEIECNVLRRTKHGQLYKSWEKWGKLFEVENSVSTSRMGVQGQNQIV